MMSLFKEADLQKEVGGTLSDKKLTENLPLEVKQPGSKVGKVQGEESKENVVPKEAKSSKDTLPQKRKLQDSHADDPDAPPLKKRKITASKVLQNKAKGETTGEKEKSAPETPKTEEELKKHLGLLKKEVSKRCNRWRVSSKQRDRKLHRLERMKKKFAKTKENMKADEKRTAELAQELATLQQEERELEKIKRARQRKNRDEISRVEREIQELKQQLFAPKTFQRPKKKPSQHFNPMKLPNHLKPCNTILKRLAKLEYIYVFEDPVDVTKYTDYLTVVKKPMCMETVREKLYGGKYATIHQFAKELRLVFANARVYNPQGNPVHNWAVQYSDVFEDLYRRATSHSAIQAQQKKSRSLLSPAEINSLQMKLANLPTNSMQRIVEFLRKEVPGEFVGDEITIDLDSLPGKVVLKLREIVLNEAKFKHRNRAQKRQRIKRQIESLQKNSAAPAVSLPPPDFQNALPPPPSFSKNW